MKIRLFVFFIVLILGCSGAVFAQENPAEMWDREISLGYNQANGNTKNSQLLGSFDASRKTNYDELTIRGNTFYSSQNKKMDGQKWDALAKYSFDFGEEYRWFNFYQVFVDHDYFADIDYRITPTVGIGYHLANTEDWAWDVDTGIGYRITRHRINTAEDDEVLTALAHTFMKKRVFEQASLSEDLTVYPGLKSGAGIILRSETAFTNPLQENLDLEIKYIVDYNSEPAGKKKTDTQIVAGLKYTF